MHYVLCIMHYFGKDDMQIKNISYSSSENHHFAKLVVQTQQCIFPHCPMFQLWSELRWSRGLSSMLRKLVKIIGNWAGQEDSKGGIWVLGRWQFTSPVCQWGRWLFHDGKRWKDCFQGKKGVLTLFTLTKGFFDFSLWVKRRVVTFFSE